MQRKPMRIIRAADCRVMPWKNGGGTTTEIAVSPEGATIDSFDWRVSMAHVGADGPFSSFPGVDRTLSVLTGNGIRLAFDDGETVTLDRTSAPFAFAADRTVDGVLIDEPITDLNVMSRRGAWSHSVERLTGPASHRVENGDILLLVAPMGGWTIEDVALGAHDSVMIGRPAAVTCTPDAADSALYAIRLTARP